MSPTPTPHDVIFFESPDDLRAWLDAHHGSATELWVGQHRKSTGRPTVTWSEAVDEALCFGWIDGIRYSLDNERFAQRLTPRRKGSNWSAVNVAKVAALTAEGRMRPAGLAAFEARTPEKTAVYSYEREAASFTEEETARFRANAAAWADWERRPPSYRKPATYWVASAKRAETRERRLATLIEASAAGRKVGHSPGRGTGEAQDNVRPERPDAAPVEAAPVAVRLGQRLPRPAGGWPCVSPGRTGLAPWASNGT